MTQTTSRPARPAGRAPRGMRRTRIHRAWFSCQLGAALVVFLGGVACDALGSYDLVWYTSGALCAVAVLTALAIRRRPVRVPAAAPAV
ncbi:hypothetical protein ACFY1P_26455 [Streptomyces sp. NPDC001407]|uniref:hypothetical protein n=1 Tax=Streptomyces sp. NPDC001407 TaxID=3364573 RepID=UPI0036AC8421